MARRIGIVAAIVAVAMAYALLDRETGITTLIQLHGEVEADRARAEAIPSPSSRRFARISRSDEPTT
jgi:hypothetical protein